MAKVFVAVDVEWIALAYGDLTRVMQTPEQFKKAVLTSAERFGMRWEGIEDADIKIVLYDAPRDQSRGVIHNELQNRGFELKLGHVMERRQFNGSVSAVQKGVDVMLTVDAMVEMAAGATTFIILTSDTDFVPLLQHARFAGIKTIVLGRNGATSPLTKAADIACALVLEESEGL